MPFEEALLIAMKDGVVELTANLVDAHRDGADAFIDSVTAMISDHQYQAMTDATILDPPDVALSTAIISRDPIPQPLQDALISLGFVPIESEGGGRDQRSLFSRFQKRARSRLDKWRSVYARAREVSPKLGELEECMIEEMPPGDYEEIAEAASEVLVNGARTCLRVLLAPGVDGLRQLERAIGQERAGLKGRWVLHPALVRGITAFTGQTIRSVLDAEWTNAEDGPLSISAVRGPPIATDPEYRVVKFVVKGSKELLTAYVDSLVAQVKG